MRSPMQAWEDDFNRLFAGLPAQRPIGYRIWGDVMAFQGTINPTDAVVLRVESPTPSVLEGPHLRNLHFQGMGFPGHGLEGLRLGS